MSTIYVSDKVNKEYTQWSNGDMVCISAGTGTGKSHFVRNELYDYAKANGERILFISNRDKLKEQNKLYIQGKEDTITIINYQAIEAVMLRGEKFNFDLFKYVVCDESHYFLTESSFNRNNDLSLMAILNIENSVRLFMTATGKSFFSFLLSEYDGKNTIWRYAVKKDNSRIKRLYFFNKDEALEKFIDKEIKSDEKVLYFRNNVEDIYKLSNKYKDSLFIFSDPYKVSENGVLVKKSPENNKNDKYAKHLDRDAIKEIIDTQTLNRQFTFTTTTMDNGVDIFDEKLKYIICDNIRDFDILVQCIGRKRFMDHAEDTVTIIIRNINNMALGGMSKKLSDTLSEVNTFIQDGTKIWIEKCNRYSNSDYCIYDTEGSSKYGSNKKVNRAKYEKIKADYNLLREIIAEDREERDKMKMNGQKGEHVAFIRHAAKLLDQSTYTVIDDVYGQYELDDYLGSIVGNVMLTLKDRKELIERMNIRQDGKLLKSIDSLNSALKERESNFYIIEFQTSKIIDGKKKNYKNAWKVIQLSDG